MKTKEVETINKKLAELTDDELEHVAGGYYGRPLYVTHMKCDNPNCNYEFDWVDNYEGGPYACPQCGQNTFYGVQLIAYW